MYTTCSLKMHLRIYGRMSRNYNLFFCLHPLRRKGTRIVLWTEDQEQELQMLFEEYKDSDGKSWIS